MVLSKPSSSSAIKVHDSQCVTPLLSGQSRQCMQTVRFPRYFVFHQVDAIQHVFPDFVQSSRDQGIELATDRQRPLNSASSVNEAQQLKTFAVIRWIPFSIQIASQAGECRNAKHNQYADPPVSPLTSTQQQCPPN